MSASVSYPIAKDESGRWVNIDEAQRGGNYFCPECDSPFVVRLGTVRRHHFAHKPGYTGVCTGESGFHHLAKYMLAYHFEQEGQIPLLAKCPDCTRVLEEIRKIVKVEVEKGQSDYRPDVRLILEDGLVIDCEVVFRNPLGDKLTAYREKGANLLVWEIEGQVDEVPHQIQYSWEYASEDTLWNILRRVKNKLLLFTSLTPYEHECSPYGVAYIVEANCWKCHRKTKVVLLSSWFPMWDDPDKLGSVWCGYSESEISYYEYIPFNRIPSGFWVKLNRDYGTNLSVDWSKTVSEKYLMNHCIKCGAKIGDFYLCELITDGSGQFLGKKVTIDFKLTKWEKEASEKYRLKTSQSKI